MSKKDLCAAIGALMGDRPRIEWVIQHPETRAICLFVESRREAEEWLADTNRRFPDGWVATGGYQVSPLEIWPDYLADQEAVARFTHEALRRLGPCSIIPLTDGGFEVTAASGTAGAATLARALAALLGVSGESADETDSETGV